MKIINIRGARTHNLKDISLSIPRNQLVVITGLSGSGKSSLAFNTLYAEGQRRYVESLSAYARQFLSVMEKPDVDLIEGLSPAISIEQKTTSHNPRSTVGTITEIYDYLRLLFARIGQPRCPIHHITLEAQTVSQMVDSVLALPTDTRLMLLAPLIRDRKGEYAQLIDQLRVQGFIRARIDGHMTELDAVPKLDLQKKHTIEVVIDRFKLRDTIQQRLAESFETALKLSEGLAIISYLDNTSLPDIIFSSKYACPHCGFSLPELEPRLFSFNNPAGACPTCDGLGIKQFFDPDKIIHDSKLSLENGAIRGWDRRNLYYYHFLLSLAKHYRFKIDKPFRELPKSIQHIILYGSGDDKIPFHYLNEKGSFYQRTHPFEGVIPNMQRRYQETESDAVREQLAHYLTLQPCDACEGTRLKETARCVYVHHKNLPTITALSIEEALSFFSDIPLTGNRAQIAKPILKEIQARLKFLIDVGLNYLTLNRSAETLSGGEAQRIRLASQIGAGLVGVLYVLDEPSIGLHQRDNQRLLNTLIQLRNLGNSVIVIEHDREAILSADHLIDLGPGAGIHGGYVVAQGTAQDVMQVEESLTGQYLSGKKKIDIPSRRAPINPDRMVRLKGVKTNNLKNIDVSFPVGLFTCITGVSGSGKSSLINDTLYPLAAIQLNRASQIKPGPHRSISGLSFFDHVVDINQSPIGRTPRSNPATYTGIFTPIRELFSATPEARARGYLPGRFSFNVKGGRCEHCEGDGVIKVEMHFLADVYVTCEACQGKRYNRETLDIHFKGKNIHHILDMTIEEARQFFDAIPVLARKLQTLLDVGLSYIKLGQSATTLSGGEAQRIKLAKELSRRDTGNTLYILDEPTTGLHFHDITQLLSVLHRLRDHGNTIIVIEHNLDVIKTADWIIDLGPEGGDKGGKIITEGPPETIAEVPHSYTGQFLKSVLHIEK